MALQFASLGSGSKGNATLVKSDSALLMVDCGFSIKETERRLAQFGHQPDQLTAILVTHEHSDHIAGVGRLARKYGLPVYATHGTLRHKSLAATDRLQIINCEQSFTLADIEITPVAVPHDASEPCQYLFSKQSKTFGVLTDLGSITPHVTERYRHCDALMLESNHDPAMLSMGPYPPSLKQRVSGRWGHLSNQQAANFLRDMDCRRLQHLVISHISEQNNTEQLARAAITEVFGDGAELKMADQQQGLGWLGIV
jgi:phosphoribosyl 1,2-cyclic phosphodiesterase